jgi:hypothetical protein
MKTSAQLRTLLIAVAFVFFSTVGFLSVNVMTSCETRAQCACTAVPCIAAIGGLDTVIPLNVMSLGIIPMLIQTQFILSVNMDLDLAGFFAAVTEKILGVTENLTEWIDTFWYYNLLPAMQAMTRQLNAFNTFKDEHSGGAADMADENRVNNKFMARDMESHREQQPSENICVAGTVTGNMTRNAVFRRNYEKAATLDSAPRGDNSTTVSGASALSSSADQLQRYMEFNKYYCNQDYNGGFGCTTNGVQPDADLQVAQQIFMKDTIDLPNNGGCTGAVGGCVPPKRVIDDIIVNIVEPVVAEPVNAAALTTEAGQQALLKYQAYKTKRQVLYDALYFVVARRAPGAGKAFGNGNFLQAIRTAAGLNASYFNTPNYNPSHNEILEVMMSERFRTGQMSVDQIDEPENNGREMVVQQAFQAMLLNDQLDLLDRYGLILAAQAAHDISKNKPMNPQTEAKAVR